MRYRGEPFAICPRPSEHLSGKVHLRTASSASALPSRRMAEHARLLKNSAMRNSRPLADSSPPRSHGDPLCFHDTAVASDIVKLLKSLLHRINSRPCPQIGSTTSLRLRIRMPSYLVVRERAESDPSIPCSAPRSENLSCLIFARMAGLIRPRFLRATHGHTGKNALQPCCMAV